MNARSNPAFPYWLSAIDSRSYAFQARPSKATKEALLIALEGYRDACTQGMSVPVTAPAVKQEASSKAAWWEMQVQEAVTMFRLNPSQERFDSVGALADQYMAWKTSPRR
jgi:hypothetical protein